MPKAYGEDDEARHVGRHAQSEPTIYGDVYDADTPPFSLAKLRPTIGEILSALTIFYCCCIAAFNAGYFYKIPGRFVTLFSFTDLLGANVPLLQYFISVYIFYSVISLFAVFAPGDYQYRLQYWVDDKLDALSGFAGLLLIFGALLCALMASAVLKINHVSSFTANIAPWALLQTIGFYISWHEYRRGALSARSLFVSLLIGVIIFSYNSGSHWMSSEIEDSADQQSLYTQSGNCLDRKLLKTTSNGYLLYACDLKQFEYRDKADIRTIFATKGCS